MLIYIFFWSIVLIIIHSYLIYPLSIYLLKKTVKKGVNSVNKFEPEISILIAVYNEELVIEKTLRNFLNSTYDILKIEFIIGSDNSTDKTNEIITNLKNIIPNLQFYPFSKRRGKSQILNDLVKYATGKILVFSDANTIYQSDALTNLVRHFTDSEIGGVSGRLLLLDHERAAESGNQESKYWEFENWIKENEGSMGCLIGANGGIYSIRKDLFIPLPTDSPVMDDFYISLKVLEQRKKFIYDKSAIAREEIASDIKIEFRRRIRNNAIDLSSIKFIKELLKPKFGIISYGLWSHKIIRWLSPILLVILLITNIIIFNVCLFYSYLLFFQVLLYLCSYFGYLFTRMGIKFLPFALCYYFVFMNLALLLGIFRFLRKKQPAFWQSTKRS
jgi:cellulose synthase/poly-beta-1,6-N-acetylglucosamine synthase-like glycosyltransferase